MKMPPKIQLESNVTAKTINPDQYLDTI